MAKGNEAVFVRAGPRFSAASRGYVRRQPRPPQGLPRGRSAVPGRGSPEVRGGFCRPVWTPLCPDTIRGAQSRRSPAPGSLRRWGAGRRKHPAGPARRLMLRAGCGSLPGTASTPGGAGRAGWKRRRAGTWRGSGCARGSRRATSRSRIAASALPSARRAANREFMLRCREVSLLAGRRGAGAGTLSEGPGACGQQPYAGKSGPGAEAAGREDCRVSQAVGRGGGGSGQRRGAGTGGEDRGAGGKGQPKQVLRTSLQASGARQIAEGDP